MARSRCWSGRPCRRRPRSYAPHLLRLRQFGSDFFEALEGRTLARLEARELLRLADLQPELDDDRAASGEMLLELIDFGIGAHPILHGAEPFDALDQHAPVPRAVEDGDAAPRRYLFPEPPEVGCAPRPWARRSAPSDIKAPCVDAGHAADGPALAGRIDTLEDQDQRVLGEALVPRRRQLALQLLELRRIFRRGESFR